MRIYVPTDIIPLGGGGGRGEGERRRK